MERFVQAIVAGGLALLVGLWLTTAFAVGSPPWFAALTLVAVGLVGLAAGIGHEVDY